MKTQLVIFTSNNARILVGHNPAEYPHALVNPDLSLVKRVPTHFWKLAGGKIVPMTAKEQAARLADHAKNAVDNDVTKIVVKKKFWQVKIDKSVWAAAAGAGAAYLAGWLA